MTVEKMTIRVQTELPAETHRALLAEKYRRQLEGEPDATLARIIREAIQDKFGDVDTSSRARGRSEAERR